MRIRAWVLCSAAGLLLAGQAISNPASADDLTVSGTVDEPLETVDPAGDGGTPGNIIIETAGTVAIEELFVGAITLNSDNTLTINGTVANTVESDAIGVHILGGFTGGLSGTGSITVSGIGPDGQGTPGTGNIAVLLDGAGAFTGDIDLHSMTIVASGPGAVGVAIDTVLNGNLSLGNTAAVGEGSTPCGRPPRSMGA